MNLGRLSEKLARRVGLPDDTNPYIYYDLNWICIVPNMDPHINSFEVLKETEEEIIVRTGYEATGQKIHAFPIPDFLKFETDTLKTIVLRKLMQAKVAAIFSSLTTRCPSIFRISIKTML